MYNNKNCVVCIAQFALNCTPLHQKYFASTPVHKKYVPAHQRSRRKTPYSAVWPVHTLNCEGGDDRLL